MKRIGVAAASAAVIILTGAGGSYAADLPAKAPLAPAGPATCTGFLDFFTSACQLAWYGVRFYGTIDVGANYMTKGAPLDPLAGPGLNYFPGKDSHGGRFNFAPGGLSLSNVGLQIKEPLGAGWSFIGQVEAGFNSASWDLANSPGSVHENAGLPLLAQKAPGDGSADGHFYNDLGYAGFSHDTWGTLTFGKQNDLMKDGILSYDPFGNAYAFSYIGYFGATGGGGNTENAKASTAVKYRVNFGNWHAGLFTQIGGLDDGNAANAVFQGNIGADFHVGPGLLSTELIAGHTKDSINEALAGGVLADGTVDTTVAQHLAVTISDNTNVMALAKYTWDKLKLYAGYEWMQFAAPSDTINQFTDISGTFIQNGALLNGQAITISSTAFSAKDKIQQTAWVGARYSLTPTVDLITSYYHVDVNQFATGATAAACQIHPTSNNSCHGTIDTVSAAIDWQFAAKWDTYIGVMWTDFRDGQANGLLCANGSNSCTDVSTTAGLRFRW